MSELAVLSVSAVVSLGLLAGSFFPTRERAFQVIGVLSLPLFFLANLSWPKPATPLPLTWLATLLPTTPGINAMVAVCLYADPVGVTHTQLYVRLGKSGLEARERS